MRWLQQAGLILSTVGFAFVLGCDSGPKVVTVKGKLTKGGQPYKLERVAGADPLPPGELGVRVLFRKVGGGDNYESYAVLDAAAMTFSVPGYDGKGIPPGDYEVIVMALTGERPKAPASGAPPGGMSGPPGVRPPGSGGPPSDMVPTEGKEVAKMKVTIPDTGKTDLVIEVK